MNILDLKIKAAEIRKQLIKVIYEAKTGHLGGDLSSTDIMTVLHYAIMKIDPSNPKLEERDRFILSKGHCVEAYYAILADMGFFDKELLKTYSKFESDFIGHPNNKIPGIEMNTGALGHGLSIGVGMAIGLKKNNSNSKVFVLMGDGEMAEGSVWEAIMSASNYKLDNLTAIIDRNHLQISGNTEDVMALEPLKKRIESFGWYVTEIDGNNIEKLVETFSKIPFEKDKPSMIIANTIKGKGIKEIENIAKWHHGVPDEALYNTAMSELDNVLEGLKNGK